MNYTVLDSSVAYKGKILSVHLDEIKYEATGRKSKREVVVKDAFAMVLPVMPNGNIVTVRQFRHPFQEMVRIARSSNQRRWNISRVDVRHSRNSTSAVFVSRTAGCLVSSGSR